MKTACVISSYAYIYENINYGALLQYYALERAMDKFGIEAYWLRYCFADSRGFKHEIKNLVKRLLDSTGIKEYEKCLLSFRDFLDKYCRLSHEVYWNEKEVYDNLPNADYYITGSDQVWGSTLSVNYLTFAPDNLPKISYAASFGRDTIVDEHKRIIEPWLKRLDAISVREESGVAICNSLGVNAKLVLDPTLLIDREEYPTIQMNSSPEIYCYFLNFNDIEKDLYWSRIIDLSVKRNLTLEVSCTSQTYKFFDDKYRTIPSPEEWLTKYSRAQYIITNTFHGTVFALVYHKNFLVLKQKGEGAKQNGRVESLLKLVDLSCRYYDDNQDIEEQITRAIDWDKVDERIKRNRLLSYDFIRKSIKM